MKRRARRRTWSSEKLPILPRKIARGRTFAFPGADNWSRDAFEKRTRAVAALAALTVEHGSEHKHIWRGARKRLTQIDRQRLDERLRDILPRLDTARTVLREAARIVGIEDAGCAAAVEDVAGHLDALDAMPDAVPGLLDTEAVLEQPTMVLDLCENIAAAQVLRSNLVSDVVETALDLEWIEVRIAIAHRGRSIVPLAEQKLPEGSGALAIRSAVGAAERPRWTARNARSAR